MAKTKATKAAAGKSSRYSELRKMLEERRRELMTEVQGRMRDVRSAEGKDREVLDQGESSEVDIQDDIEFALIQMKSETLHKIEDALARLEEGTFKNCFECGTCYLVCNKEGAISWTYPEGGFGIVFHRT